MLHALILTELVEMNLETVGLHCPETLLKIGFACLVFIVGFNGTHTLGILYLFFVVPAAIFLLTLCFQGLGWLTFSLASPEFFPHQWSALSFGEWAKWFFIATYSVYSCETASSFVADSRQPSKTQSRGKVQDFVRLQVVVLVLLLCGAVTIGWIVSGKLDRSTGEPKADLLVILLVTLSFVGVVFACWTTLPQIAAIDEAREQVKNLFITAVDSEIVGTIVTLAHSLNLAVTAKGIETKEQLAQLKELRCEYGQGYLFSQPLETKAAEALIATSPQW